MKEPVRQPETHEEVGLRQLTTEKIWTFLSKDGEQRTGFKNVRQEGAMSLLAH